MMSVGARQFAVFLAVLRLLSGCAAAMEALADDDACDGDEAMCSVHFRQLRGDLLLAQAQQHGLTIDQDEDMSRPKGTKGNDGTVQRVHENEEAKLSLSQAADMTHEGWGESCETVRKTDFCHRKKHHCCEEREGRWHERQCSSEDHFRCD